MARKIEGSWSVVFRFCRKRYRLKSPGNNKAGAREFERQVRQQLHDGPFATKKIPTFAKWFEGRLGNEWVGTAFPSRSTPSTPRLAMRDRALRIGGDAVQYRAAHADDRAVIALWRTRVRRQRGSGRTRPMLNNGLHAVVAIRQAEVDSQVIMQAVGNVRLPDDKGKKLTVNSSTATGVHAHDQEPG